ncbi:MAG: rod shape-determining protein MreC [Patescibacteria group bacterium]
MALASAVFLAFFGIGTFASSIFPVVSRVIVAVASPMLSFEKDFTDTTFSFFSLFRTEASFLRENLGLKEKITQMELSVLDRDLLYAENEELKGLLDRPFNKGAIVARVLSAPPESPYDTFLVDRGFGDGVLEKSFVTSGGGLIGEIVSVYPRNSLVRLFSSPGSRVAVRIGPSHIPAEAIGMGDGNFEITLPRGTGVAEGDFVSLSLVPDKVLGVVEFVGVGSSDTFEKILLRLPVNLTEILWVYIGTKD